MTQVARVRWGKASWLGIDGMRKAQQKRRLSATRNPFRYDTMRLEVDPFEKMKNLCKKNQPTLSYNEQQNISTLWHIFLSLKQLQNFFEKTNDTINTVKDLAGPC